MLHSQEEACAPQGERTAAGAAAQWKSRTRYPPRYGAAGHRRVIALPAMIRGATRRRFSVADSGVQLAYPLEFTYAAVRAFPPRHVARASLAQNCLLRALPRRGERGVQRPARFSVGSRPWCEGRNAVRVVNEIDLAGTASDLGRERLADNAGLHRTCVGSAERGERDVSTQALDAWLFALGLAWQLFGEAMVREGRAPRKRV